MTRRVLASYLVMTGFVVLVLAVPLGITVARSERAQLVASVERDATVLAGLVEDTLEHGATGDLDGVAANYARRTDSRVVIVDAEGISVGDSDPPGTSPRDYSTRPEIAAALDGRIASGDRFSQTLASGLLYVAVPVTSGGTVHGAVRITYPTAAVDARIRRSWWTLAAIGGVALTAAAVVGVALARSVTRPVHTLQATARRFAGGDLSARADTIDGAPELRDLAASLNAMAGRLEQLLDSQRAFIADASHQLRTPLTALRLRLEGLDALTDLQRAEVDAALDEVVRLGRLVDGLLTLARAEGSQVPMEPVDVAPLVGERVEAWQPYAEELGVHLQEVCDGSVRALALPGALEQILDNYLANALRVAPPGSDVTVRCRQAGDRVVVTVLDAGPGLRAEERERAFDRFWRGGAVERDTPDPAAEGFGLGLAIVRRLAAAGGGRAELREGPDGVGIEALVELPLAPPAPPRGTGDAPAQPSVTRSPVPPADGDATRLSRPGSGTR